MSGISIIVDEKNSRRILARLRELGRNPQPLLAMIAAMGASQTRERFASETDPDGVKWKPSARATKKGGKTLTLHGILANSITSFATSQVAQWGTNVIYARIHQFGGLIKRAARAVTLRFRLGANGDLMSQADRGAKFRNADQLRVFAKGSHKRVQEQQIQVGAYVINMPQRAFLGVSDENAKDFLDALAGRVRQEAS